MHDRPANASKGAEGIILVLVAGIVSLLLILSLGLLRAARQASVSAEAGLAAARAALAADSGCAYAAARMSETWKDTYPRWNDGAERRGDSWLFRASTDASAAGAPNPSFSHGEAWTDASFPADGADNDGDGLADEAGEGDGVFSPGDAPGPDRDGDGRFSAWSGRLRGGRRSLSLRFILRVDAPEGRIPLNSGYLDRQDRNANGIPDHRDLGWQGHRAVQWALDNLGAILFPLSGTRRASMPPDGGVGLPFELSRLGVDLLGARPAGGYRSIREVRETMARLGYTVQGASSEHARIAPYLDLGPYDGSPEGCRDMVDQSGDDFPPYAPVCLSVASPEALQSLWMHVKLSEGILALEPAARLAFASFAGQPFGSVNPVIRKEEARALADLAVVESRSGRLRDWKELRSLLLDRAPALFPVDWADLGATPLSRRRWAQAKADLAFGAVATDPGLVQGGWHAGGRLTQTGWGCIAATAEGWGIDRDPSTDGIQQEWGGRGGTMGRIPWEVSFDPGYWREDPNSEAIEALLPGNPQGVTLLPPVRFSATSVGEEAGRAGLQRRIELRVAERLELGSQEDFEAYGRGLRSLARGVRVDDAPGWASRRDWRDADDLSDGTAPAYGDGSRRRHAHAGTFPCDPIRDIHPGAPPAAYPRSRGILTLAGRECGFMGATLLDTFPEDGDGIAANEGILEAAAGAPIPPVFSGGYNGLWGVLSCGFVALPGFSPPSADPHVDASVEFWVAEGSHAEVFSASFPTYRGIDLVAYRESDADGSYFTVQLYLSRETGAAGSAIAIVQVEERGSPGGRVPLHHHVVLTVKRYADPLTFVPFSEARLVVDGEDVLGIPAAARIDGYSIERGSRQLKAIQVDELRFHDRALFPREGPGLALPPPAEAFQRYREGRFVREATFLSPRYVLDEPAEIGRVVWTGFVPPGFPASSLAATLEGLSTAPGDPGHPASAAGCPRILPAPGIHDARPPVGPVRSFRYKVRLDSSGAAGVLDDSPAFESIELVLRRPRRVSGWSRYEAGE